MGSQAAEQIFRLGISHKDRGLNRRAVALFCRVLELDPGHQKAREELRTLPCPDNRGSGRAAA